MTSLQRIWRILLAEPHGAISSNSSMIRNCAIHLWKQLQPDVYTCTRTLSSRHCSKDGLAPRCSYGEVPNKPANEMPLCLSNSCESVCVQKRRHYSGQGLAPSFIHGTGSGEPSNKNALSLSNSSQRTYFLKWRQGSRHGLALRQSSGMSCCKLSNEDERFLSNSSLRIYVQKRMLFSRGCCESSSRNPIFWNNSFQGGFLNERRHCSGQGLAFQRSYGTSSHKSTNEGALSMSNPSLRAYLEHLAQEHQGICRQLQDENNASDGKKQKRLRRRRAELAAVVEKVGEWKEKLKELTETEELIAGATATAQDKEMKEMAIQEKQECLEDIDNLGKEILSLLTPVDDADDNDIIMEFSAGVGGQEAMLFTADMFEMYERFAAYMNWSLQRLEYFTTDLGGLRHATVSISGDGAYKLMKNEAGVHRVQRIPKTEKAGRIHTSTMAVAVLPQPTEIDLKLDPKELRVETKKASGAGGQHVNTTDSAVRILHIPTGIAAESQQERSQLKNRAIAMTLLQTKIYSALLAERETAERSLRRSQVGTSGRSEKIRTYNYQQDRVTDHRVGRSVFDVEGFLSGGDRLEEMLSGLAEEEEKEAVTRMLEDFVASQKT